MDIRSTLWHVYCGARTRFNELEVVVKACEAAETRRRARISRKQSRKDKAPLRKIARAERRLARSRRKLAEAEQRRRQVEAEQFGRFPPSNRFH